MLMDPSMVKKGFGVQYVRGLQFDNRVEIDGRIVNCFHLVADL
jgi:hypothetical protein